MEFNSSKIQQHIINYSNRVESLVMFFKNMEKGQNNSGLQIVSSIQEKAENEFVKKIHDKDIKKKMDHFTVHDKEKNHNQANVQFIRNKLLQWLTQAKNEFLSIKQDLRNLQSKKIKKSMNENDVKEFKEKLKKATIELQKKQLDIMKTAAKHFIKNNCEIIQSLTNLMQSHQSTIINQQQISSLLIK